MRALVAPAAVALALLAASLLVALKAEAKIPPNATTTTNVCVFYAVDGVHSGGVRIVEPETVSYRYNGRFGTIFLWLPSQDRLKVDYLTVAPLSTPEC